MIKNRELYDEYRNSGPKCKLAVDYCYDAMYKELESQGMSVGHDDRAENLVAAIFEYFKDCGNDTTK